MPPGDLDLASCFGPQAVLFHQMIRDTAHISGSGSGGVRRACNCFWGLRETANHPEVSCAIYR
jgi:hypothetical protein